MLLTYPPGNDRKEWEISKRKQNVIKFIKVLVKQDIG